jgi:hypothetical protein
VWIFLAGEIVTRQGQNWPESGHQSVKFLARTILLLNHNPVPAQQLVLLPLGGGTDRVQAAVFRHHSVLLGLRMDDPQDATGLPRKRVPSDAITSLRDYPWLLPNILGNTNI